MKLKFDLKKENSTPELVKIETVSSSTNEFINRHLIDCKNSLYLKLGQQLEPYIHYNINQIEPPSGNLTEFSMIHINIFSDEDLATIKGLLGCLRMGDGGDKLIDEIEKLLM